MHLDDDDLVLYYYGEPDAPDRAAEHLETCGDCRLRYARLQRVMAVVDTLPAPALSEGFERTVWARLEPELSPRRPFLSFLAGPGGLAWAATVVLLVAAAFLAGRLSRPEAPTIETLTAEQIQEGILLTELDDHLQRSQAVLVELVSAEPPADAGRVDISLERDRAADLVAANRLYRQTAHQTGDGSIAQLLDELERLLVELAAGPGELSTEDMDRVRSRIAAKDLLFKVRVVSSAIRARQAEQIRARAGQSS